MIPRDKDEDPWLAAEPGFFEARLELMRLVRRALKRPIIVILVAAAMASAATWKRSRRKPLAQATVLFRMIENRDANTENAPPPPAHDLREYVWSVALAGSNLMEVMRKRDLGGALLDNDPVTAVAMFRENIELYVWRNYFLVDEGRDAERSARLAITFNAPDLEQARLVASDLSDLVAKEEDRRRRLEVQGALEGARLAVELARADVDRRAALIARFEGERPTASAERAALIDVELAGLRKTIKPATERLLAAQKDLTALELQVNYEALGAGLRFEKVDESAQVVARLPSTRGLLLFGGFIFVAVLPVVLLLVGALDPRVYDAEDVRRLGITVLGHVPPFRGADVGTLRARARASGRL